MTHPAPGLLGAAFGGGGVKGWAHLGVLSVMDRVGLRPRVVAGTSAGAITAAYYAAGYTIEQMMEVMRGQRTRGLFSWRFDGQGLLTTDAFERHLRGHLGDVHIEDLEYPCVLVATDFSTGKEVVIERGPLVEAVMASSALPGIFAPVMRGGRWLMDGGIANNVPVSALVYRGATHTIGVQIHKRIGALSVPETAPPEVEAKVGLAAWTDRLRTRFRIPGTGRAGEPEGPNALEAVQRALDVMMAQLEGYRLQSYPPDVLVVPEAPQVGILQFSDEKEDIFEAGVRAAEARLDDLLALKRQLDGG